MGSSWNNLNLERWARGFAALAKFRAREGHCCPGRRYVEGNFKLGQWVSVQRYYKDFLPVERKRLLDAIGFVWDCRDQLWEQNFAALLKFKRQEGHCCVPTYYRKGDLKLGWWVATQRRTVLRLPRLSSFFICSRQNPRLALLAEEKSTVIPGRLGASAKKHREPLTVPPVLGNESAFKTALSSL